MSKLNGQWIEVFRAGDYGDKGKYSPAHLDEMVANYDATSGHEAPIVIGHPADNAPAFGWVEGLRRQGDVLLAKLKQVQPQFEEMVRSGMFKKRSISFYSRPKLMLRHVGFLGAMPPEVKGLADVRLCEFRDGENGQHNAIEFNEETEMTLEEMKKAIKDAFTEFAEKFRPQATAEGAAKFSDEDITKVASIVSGKFAEDKKERETLAQQVKDLSEKIANNDKTSKTASVVALAEGAIAKLKAAGKYIPAFDKMGVPEIFAELAKSETKVSFGEGDKKTEKTALEIFGEFMEALPKIVPTGEIAKAAAKTKTNLVKFTEPKGKGFEIDQDSVEFAEAATALAAKEKIPYGDAMTRLRAEGWQPVEAGSAAAGSA